MLKTRTLLIVLIFLSAACHNEYSKELHLTQMNKFKQIDIQLNALAQKLGTSVATSGGGSNIDGVDVPKDKLEMRKIVWIDGSIGKAIIITPNFENKNIDSPNWDFVNLAWLESDALTRKERPFWQKHLLTKVRVEKIDSSIHELLKQSLDNLSAIKESHLGYQ